MRARVLAAGVLVAVVLAGVAAARSGTGAIAAASPAQLSKTSSVARHFEYVVNDRVVTVYDIDRAHRVVQRISLPQMEDSHGIVAHPRSGRLFISYGGQGGSDGDGSMLAYDLLRGRVLWQRDYSHGIDSIAITPNGKTIYLPAGEQSGDGRWFVIDPANGKEKGSISAGDGAHNTIVSLDGKLVFLAGVDHPYLVVARTDTNKVIREIGPLLSGGRPFTVNGRHTLTFMTVRGIVGFQVGDVATGKILYTVPVPGFTYDPESFGHSPCHGISLSPDEKQLYVIDTPNGYVHVFDVSGVPASAPRHLADIKLPHAPPSDGWLQHSRNGRYVYVGRAGDVIDTRTRKVVAYLPTIDDSADFIEIDWKRGRPVATTSRYGLGYKTR